MKTFTATNYYLFLFMISTVFPLLHCGCSVRWSCGCSLLELKVVDSNMNEKSIPIMQAWKNIENFTHIMVNYSND